MLRSVLWPLLRLKKTFFQYFYNGKSIQSVFNALHFCRSPGRRVLPNPNVLRALLSIGDTDGKTRICQVKLQYSLTLAHAIHVKVFIFKSSCCCWHSIWSPFLCYLMMKNMFVHKVPNEILLISTCGKPNYTTPYVQTEVEFNYVLSFALIVLLINSEVFFLQFNFRWNCQI